MSPQSERVLEYLRSHEFITPIMALMECDCGRLAAVIKELGDLGFGINMETHSYTNSYGKAETLTRYFLVRDSHKEESQEREHG